MYLFIKKFFCIFQKFSCNHYCSSCSVTHLAFLCFCNFNHHFSSRMLYLHFFKNCDTVIRYYYIICRRNKHLVHPLWPKGSFNNVRDHSGCHNIVSLRVFSENSLHIFRHKNYWFFCHFIISPSSYLNIIVIENNLIKFINKNILILVWRTFWWQM